MIRRAPPLLPALATRRLLLRCLGALALAGLWGPRRVLGAERSGFRVVAHAANRETRVSREFLTDAFLKKVTRWGDGEAIRPVDLPPSSAVRAAFSEAVLRRSVAAVRAYWQQRIFSGRGVPPPELASDEAVLEFVRNNRGAVGYVSAHTPLQEVKVIEPR